MRTLVLLVFSAGLACSPPARSDAASRDSALIAPDTVAAPVNVYDLLELIDRAGPDSAVRVYFGSRPRETFCGEAVTDSIARGDSLWLVAAERLAPGTDACSSEGLVQAVSLALARAPAHVLSMIGARFTLEAICSLPFYEGTPDSVIAAHYRIAVAAVERVSDPKLSAKRDACLRLFKEHPPAR